MLRHSNGLLRYGKCLLSLRTLGKKKQWLLGWSSFHKKQSSSNNNNQNKQQFFHTSCQTFNKPTEIKPSHYHAIMVPKFTISNSKLALFHSSQLFSDLSLNNKDIYKVKLILMNALFLSIEENSFKYLHYNLKPNKIFLQIFDLFNLKENEMEIKLKLERLQKMDNLHQNTMTLEDRIEYCNLLMKKIFLIFKKKEPFDFELRKLYSGIKKVYELKNIDKELVNECPIYLYLQNLKHLRETATELKLITEDVQLLSNMMQENRKKIDEDFKKQIRDPTLGTTQINLIKEFSKKRLKEINLMEQIAIYFLGNLQFQEAITYLNLSLNISNTVIGIYEEQSKEYIPNKDVVMFTNEEYLMIKNDRNRRLYFLIELYTYLNLLSEEYSQLCRNYLNISPIQKINKEIKKEEVNKELTKEEVKDHGKKKKEEEYNEILEIPEKEQEILFQYTLQDPQKLHDFMLKTFRIDLLKYNKFKKLEKGFLEASQMYALLVRKSVKLLKSYDPNIKNQYIYLDLWKFATSKLHFRRLRNFVIQVTIILTLIILFHNIYTFLKANRQYVEQERMKLRKKEVFEEDEEDLEDYPEDEEDDAERK
ncbi:hypothetical protein ABK040_010885 [Willaertia magna]